MADEDEVDILGDFSMDNFLSKTETNLYVFKVICPETVLH